MRCSNHFKKESKTNSIFYVLMFFSLLGCGKPFIAIGQDGNNVAQLEEHLFGIESIDPLNEDFSDLEFLIPILADKEIILLGEEDHTFASTFEAKSRLIKFLHQRLEFDVLAFEFDGFTISKVSKKKQEANDQLLPIQQSIYPFWGRTTSTNELFHYIEKTKDTKKPITYAGFDSQLHPFFNLFEDLLEILKERNSEILTYKGFQKFESTFDKLYPRQMMGADLEDYTILSMFIDDILFEFELDSALSKQELILTQSLLNVKHTILSHLSDAPTKGYLLGQVNPMDSTVLSGDARSMGSLNRRDKKMADNILWLKNSVYPNDKIIVWAASEHTMYNRHKLKKKFPPDFPFHTRFTYGYNYKGMGSYLKTYFGDKVYNLGFSTMSGKVDYSRQAAQQYVEEIIAEDGTIEALLLESKFRYPFLEFSKNRNIPNTIFNDEMYSNVIGGSKAQGNISEFFDGILFIRDAKLIEYLDNN